MSLPPYMPCVVTVARVQVPLSEVLERCIDAAELQAASVHK